jgi:hypothetical protein
MHQIHPVIGSSPGRKQNAVVIPGGGKCRGHGAKTTQAVGQQKAVFLGALHVGHVLFSVYKFHSHHLLLSNTPPQNHGGVKFSD